MVARARMRPGGRGLTNPSRCAEAVYRHVVRSGAPDRRSQPPARRRALGLPVRARGRAGPRHGLRLGGGRARRRAPGRGGAGRPRARHRAGRARGPGRRRRRSPGRGRGPGGGLRAGADHPGGDDRAPGRPRPRGRGGLVRRGRRPARRAVRDGQVPPEIETVLQAVRAWVRASGLGRRDRPADTELDKVLARIQALRAKTVDRGCTEEERSRRRQGRRAARPLRPVAGRGRAQGAGLRGLRVDIGRRRFGPIDDCIPTVGRKFATAGCGARRRRTGRSGTCSSGCRRTWPGRATCTSWSSGRSRLRPSSSSA